jgi:hypothetical protein
MFLRPGSVGIASHGLMHAKPLNHVPQCCDQERAAATRWIKNTEALDFCHRSPRKSSVQNAVDEVIDNGSRRVVNASFIPAGSIATEGVSDAKLMKISEEGYWKWTIAE